MRFREADVNPAKRVPGDAPIAWPQGDKASRAVRDYLSALDRENAEAPTAGRKRKPRMAISLTDPEAAWEAVWIAYRKIRSIFAYHANYLIDNKRGIIVDAEGNRANRIDENQACVDMVARVAQRFGLKPKRLAADTAYGNAPTLKILVERGIEPHIPIWDNSQRHDGTFSRSDFAYDQERDIYICPGGKTLSTTGRVHDGRTRLYRARKLDCDACALKPQCCPNAPHRRLPRDIDEPVRDRARALSKTGTCGSISCSTSQPSISPVP